MKLRLPTRKARGGFTLTEMIVVVAIIVVLAAIAVPITLNVLSEQKKEIAKSSMKANIVSAIKQYAIKNKELPVDVTQLLSPALGGNGSLSQEAIMDPWNNAYSIEYISEDPDNPIFNVISGGPTPGDPNSQITVNSQ